MRLHRSPQRAHYARFYVKETFTEVFKAPARFSFCYDLLLDSSQCSIDVEVEEVLHLFKRQCVPKSQ